MTVCLISGVGQLNATTLSSSEWNKFVRSTLAFLMDYSSKQKTGVRLASLESKDRSDVELTKEEIAEMDKLFKDIALPMPQIFIDKALDGEPKDQFLLGNIYQTGKSPTGSKVEKNLKEAIKWWKKAAFNGYELAQHKLGQTYMRGVGVLKDKILAHMWFNIAASNGMETAAGMRDYLEEQMSHSDINLATTRAKKCLSSNFKRCSF